MTPIRLIRLRAALVWAGVTMATGAIAVAAAPAMRSATPGDIDAYSELMVGLCAAGALAAAGWLWWVTTTVTFQVFRGATPSAAGWARRAVLAACGAAIATGTLPAHAAPALDGLALPDRAVTTNPAPGGSPTPAPGTRPATVSGSTVTVRPGDSLWALAAARLDGDATDADIADVVALLYERNARVIGPDPDLIHPGQVLDRPPSA